MTDATEQPQPHPLSGTADQLGHVDALLRGMSDWLSGTGSPIPRTITCTRIILASEVPSEADRCRIVRQFAQQHDAATHRGAYSYFAVARPVDGPVGTYAGCRVEYALHAELDDRDGV